MKRSKYVSIRYTERPEQAGIIPSVGSRRDSYDNALAETINGLYKTELIHRCAPWKSREAVELVTLEKSKKYQGAKRVFAQEKRALHGLSSLRCARHGFCA